MNVEKQTTINISLDNDKRLAVSANGVTLPDAIQLCLASIEAMCKQTLSRTDDKELIQSLREDMYEMINLGASTLLNRLFPDIDARPDLTVDAIMEAENKLLSSDEKQKEYADAYAASAQSEKDKYEHALAAANVNAPQPRNREERRAQNKTKPKTKAGK